MSDTVVGHADSLGAMVAHAWEAYHAADWVESYARWERVRAFYPDYPPPYIHGGYSLRQTGQLEAALEKLECGSRMFPEDPQLVTGIAACLEQMGRFADVDTWMQEAIPRFPHNSEIAIDYLSISQRRLCYESILRGADLLEQVHPERFALDTSIQHMVANARLQVEMTKMDSTSLGGLAARARLDPDMESQLSDSKLMLSFQSLGENCEFGLTQRHFRAEPLGLLRWTATSIHDLTIALNERFKGVGERAQTRFIKGDSEYATAHTRYGMGSHTFVKLDEENEETIFNSLLVRLGYLRRKIIEDLEEGDHIFVYTCEDGAAAQEIAALHTALQQYGSRHLLFVQKSNEENLSFTLKNATNGLMLAYVDRLGPDRLPEGDIWKPPTPNWIQLLRAAYKMRQDSEAS